MLKKVRQSRMRIRILKGTDGDHQRRQRLYRLRVRDQQHGHAVIESDSLILARILLAFTNRLFNGLPSAVCLTQRRPQGEENNYYAEKPFAAGHSRTSSLTNICRTEQAAFYALYRSGGLRRPRSQ